MAVTVPPAGFGTPTHAARARLHTGMLLQVTACVLPSALLLALESPVWASRWLFGALLGFGALNFVTGTAAATLAMTLALLPATTILKSLFFWNAVLGLFALGLAAHLARAPADRAMFRRPAVGVLLTIATTYWLCSFLLTGRYEENLRALELALAAVTVLVLSRHPQHLATALLGAALTSLALGLAFLPHGDRLGIAVIGGHRLGNPITFGLPCALLLILANADRGRWFLLQRLPGARTALSGVLGVLLLLSASRASWLAAVASLLVIMVLHSAGRRAVLRFVAVIALLAVVAMQTERGSVLPLWFDRTFSSERSLGNRTSGRSDQWMLIPAVLREVPVWGFGPGSGGAMYAHFSAREPRVSYGRGKETAWHSLYMQLIVETGLIGPAVVAVLFASLLRSGVRLWTTQRQIMPFLGTLCFFLIALTVSGLDAASGCFLGFGLMSATTGRAPPGAA